VTGWQVLTAWNFRRDTLGALLPGADAERAAALLGTRPHDTRR
jgi:hypothetical protein